MQYDIILNNFHSHRIIQEHVIIVYNKTETQTRVPVENNAGEKCVMQGEESRYNERITLRDAHDYDYEYD